MLTSKNRQRTVGTVPGCSSLRHGRGNGLLWSCSSRNEAIEVKAPRKVKKIRDEEFQTKEEIERELQQLHEEADALEKEVDDLVERRGW